MKKKNKKILYGTLATLLILGGTSAVIGVASDGLRASANEIKAQNSFLGNDLEKSFHKDLVDDETGEIKL